MHFLAQIESAVKLVDHAAAQDMRWWFLGLLVVGGAALWVVARYWASRHDKMSERLDKVQDAQAEYLKTNHAQLVSVVADNSISMKQFSATIAALQHLFESSSKKTGLILACALFLAGCAETSITLATPPHGRQPGRPARVKIASDVEAGELVITERRATFRFAKLDNSAPTRARGDNITKAGAAASSVTAAVAARAVVPVP